MRTSESKDEEFGNLLCLRNSVVLRDRLMTDAALGGPRPIKSEHSYSLLASSPPPSPTKPEANPYTPSPDSSSDAVGSSAASTIPTVDFANLDHKPLYMRGRVDGKTTRNNFSKHLAMTINISINSAYLFLPFQSRRPLYCRYRRGIFLNYVDEGRYESQRIITPRIALDPDHDLQKGRINI